MLSIKSLVDIIAVPSQVFDRIHKHQLSAWLPLTVLLVAIAAVYSWYFFTIDLYSFMETSMQTAGHEVVPEELEVILKQESVIRIASVASAVIFSALIYLLVAFYYYLAATLVAEEKLSFRLLLALVCWASVPHLLSVISFAASYALSSDYVYLSLLDKTSLANILGLGLTTPHFDLYSAITIGSIWSYALSGYGFFRLVRCSVITAIIVAIIPALLQFGLVYLF